MLQIGFTNQYYTLWDVTTEDIYTTVPTANGPISYKSGVKCHFVYLQNLSKNLEDAQRKAAEKGATDLEPNEDLYGRSTRAYGDSFEEFKPILHYTLFETPVYDMQGKAIADVDYSETITKHQTYRDEDYTIVKRPGVSALWVEYMRFEKGVEPRTWNIAKRAVLCRNMLVQLGELVKDPVSKKYMKPGTLARINKMRLLESLQTGHHFQNGQRVELELRLVDTFSFSSPSFSGYGDQTTYIHTFATKCGKLVKYMGATPPEIPEEEYLKVKATIKHGEYKGAQETKLQRISPSK